MKKFLFIVFFITLQLNLQSDDNIKFTDLIYIRKQNESITIKLKVAKAKTFKEWQKGLMNVKKMPLKCGMLFIFPDEDYRIFWMKDTYIPLDIIFLDKNQKIVGIKENNRPMSKKNITIDKKSKFVLEVNAGFVKKYGIKTGDKLIFGK